MAQRLNLRQELTSPEVERFVKNYSERLGRQVALRDIPIKNFVDVDSKLLETKVSSLFMQGATDAAGFWPELINVVNTSAPKEEVPIVSDRDFEVRTGKVSGAALEGSGGKVRSVELDTTDDEKIRYVLLNIDAEDVKLRRFNYIEQSIQAAGRRLGKHILGEVIKHYVDKAGNTQALSTDKRFVAVMKAMSLNVDDGFGTTAIVINHSDFIKAVTEETTGGTMPWLLQLSGAPLGSNFGEGVPQSGLAGYMWSKIPVYTVANDANLAGNILCIDTKSAAVFGFAPGGTIEMAQQVDTMKDLVQNKIQCKYDIANPDDDGSGNSIAIAKVTGASA